MSPPVSTGLRRQFEILFDGLKSRNVTIAEIPCAAFAKAANRPGQSKTAFRLTSNRTGKSRERTSVMNAGPRTVTPGFKSRLFQITRLPPKLPGRRVITDPELGRFSLTVRFAEREDGCLFRPAVVILIAKDAARRVVRTHFGPGCVIISDLAIPFTSRLLRGVRVAIVDDLVNVGTTIRRAAEMATACGGREIRLFAAGYRLADVGLAESPHQRGSRR